MASFETALRALNELKADGVVAEYAVGGAVAQSFWIEAIPTYDLDVFIVLPQSSGLIVSIEPIYRWAEERGHGVKAEHIVIGGVPVQFLVSPDALTDEAIARAETMQYNDVRVRVIRPEYLIALYLSGSARTAARRERAAVLRERGRIDGSLLDDIMRRFRLEF